MSARIVPLVLLAGCVVPASHEAPTTLPPVALEAEAAPASARVTLAQAAAGRPMVIDFFATWCEPCKQSMPRLQAYADQHASAGLMVVGVDVGEDRADVAPFVHALGVRYPIYLDREFHLADAVGASRVPSLLVVDAEGRILHRARALDAATRAAVDRALAPADLPR